MTAPIQLLTISVNSPEHAQALVEQFTRADSSAVALVDALLVEQLGAGELETHPFRADSRVDGSVLTALLVDGVESDPSANEAVWSIGASRPTGGLALLVLLEHLWADPLTTSMRDSGAQLLDEAWLTSGDREFVESRRG